MPFPHPAFRSTWRTTCPPLHRLLAVALVALLLFGLSDEVRSALAGLMAEVEGVRATVVTH
ncbi:hypothetical protein EI613_01915 [Azospirillum sp. 412522]|nr:hypothetical protein [Azospirillum sp. 412522]MBY6260681.1 hypothetical protein [Azospirillum sp. 412522]